MFEYVNKLNNDIYLRKISVWKARAHLKEMPEIKLVFQLFPSLLHILMFSLIKTRSFRGFVI